MNNKLATKTTTLLQQNIKTLNFQQRFIVKEKRYRKCLSLHVLQE